MKKASKRKAIHRTIRHRQKPTQAIVVRPPAPKPWILAQDEIDLYKRIVCKGATDEEFKFCLTVARRYELDPFQQQIWFVPRRDGEDGGRQYVPVVGINGLQHVAARDHADYGSVSEPEYGPMFEIKGSSRKGPYKIQAPEWARVEVKKKGCIEPTVGKVWWSEIYPNIDYAPLVRQMPRLMLAKCARAQAIRMAYPKTGGLLIPEETHSKDFQFTPEGRTFAPAEPVQVLDVNPHLSAYEQREQEGLKKLTKEQREVVEQKIAESKATTMQYRIVDEETWVISGPQEMKLANKDLLEPLVDREKGKMLANAQQLGRLISQFEARKVPFHEVTDAV